MIEIDGSYGEGGGQILRTSLSLSALLGTPVRIRNIRRGRKRPGLMAQHLAAVMALAEITSGKVKGGELGSQEVVFEPGRTKGGERFFGIGTAGATSLLLQALLPPLLFCGERSLLRIEGGTHVPMSPTFNYLKEVFLPALGRLGLNLSLGIERWGFYPKGGGVVTAEVAPAKGIKGQSFDESGAIKGVVGISGAANLPEHVARRQRDAASAFLRRHGLDADIRIESVKAFGRGSFIFLKTVLEGQSAAFSALGAVGKRAEVVGEEAAAQLIEHLQSGMCLDPHLADQIVIYLALAQGRWRITTSRVTQHLLTHLWVLGRFLGISYKVEGEVGLPGAVILESAGQDLWRQQT